MRDFIKIEADTPEEMAEFLKWYKRRGKSAGRRKKMYRELLSFLMNDIIPRIEILDKAYNDMAICLILKDLKNFIIESVG